MSSLKSVMGALGATALLSVSAVALASTDVTLDIDPGASRFKVGSTSFDLAGGALIGALDTNTADASGTCGFTVDAKDSNATFKSTRIRNWPPVSAQLELCGDIHGTVGVTDSGTATLDAPGAQARVKITGFVNCEIPCTTLNLTSDGNGEGRNYDVTTGTVTLVDDSFEIGATSCGRLVNSSIGLPSGMGNNSVALALHVEGSSPHCSR